MNNDIPRVSEPNKPIKTGDLIPFDASFLERLKTLWKFGAWEKLQSVDLQSSIKREVNQGRATMLVASGILQFGDSNNYQNARQLLAKAKDSGVPRQEIYSLLISGVFNTLGRAQAICNQDVKAATSFTRSVSCIEDKEAVPFVTRARIQEQLKQLPVEVVLSEQVVDECLVSLNEYTSNRLGYFVKKCLNSRDIYEEIDTVIESHSLSTDELVDFYMQISDHFWKNTDRYTALSFLQNAADLVHEANRNQKQKLIDKFIEQENPDLATSLAVSIALNDQNNLELNPQTKSVILKSLEDQQKALGKKSEHGHDLLLSYLSTRLQEIKEKSGKDQFRIIEIGTTRENLPGQGSTRKIGEFCKRNNLLFTTVDMDPHNSFAANEMFKSNNWNGCEAITSKGEDYLRTNHGPFEFVFLDAYDFDHGGHSSLRQSRYIKYLGSPIDDKECHLMHLDCAKSVKDKLATYGLVCVDDTWLENGQWTAKGTLAMPYLLENGFILLEARNRAALLARR